MGVHGARHPRSPRRTQAGTVTPRRACTVARPAGLMPGPAAGPGACSSTLGGVTRCVAPGRLAGTASGTNAAQGASSGLGPARSVGQCRARPPPPVPVAQKPPAGPRAAPGGRGSTGAGKPQAASPAGPPGAPAGPQAEPGLHGCQPQAECLPGGRGPGAFRVSSRFKVGSGSSAGIINAAAKCQCCTGTMMISGSLRLHRDRDSDKPPGRITQCSKTPLLSRCPTWFEVLQPESRCYDRTHWQKVMGSILDLPVRSEHNLPT